MHRYLTVALMALLVASLASLSFAGKGAMKQEGDRDGTCQRAGAGDGSCGNFVDADGDGVCDNFVDEDGDGVCDNGQGEYSPDAPDDDGDGIPNGQDDDYVPPCDGGGKQHRGGR